jgi:AcrR family transcriptional regulator
MGKKPKGLEDAGGAEPIPDGAMRRPGAKARTLKRRLQTASAGPSKDRREIILEIAKRRFAEFGYGATTIREIATDAHILSGSIYHHFDTKDEMLERIISGTLKYMLHVARSIESSEFDAEQKLVSLIKFTSEEVTRDQHTHAIIWNERRIIRQDPHFKHIASMREGIYFSWRNIYNEGSNNGLFRRNFDPFMTIANIIRLLYTTAEWHVSDGEYTLEQVMNFHMQFILNAVRPPERINEPIPEGACMDMEELARARAALATAG